jgi:SAM-dependent methyltransferase
MDCAVYAAESEVEKDHWWFVVRRNLFKKEIAKLKLPADAAILDAGTSTGTNLRMLQEMGFTNVRGLDMSDEAIRWCAEKGLGTVHKGDVCSMPFADASFDLVLATDIVEHVEFDVRALQDIRRVLKPWGSAIITVPAFEALWGLQDQAAHHKRRYTRRELVDKLKAAKCRIYRIYFFNFLLFVPIWAARQAIRIFKPKLESENQVNSPLLNSVLKAVFAVDVALAGVLHVPFGVSIYALIGRNDG